MTGRGSTCRRCAFYRSAGVDGNGEFGECRINPPILIRDGGADMVMEGWPRTMGEDWCGRFARKPEWSTGSKIDPTQGGAGVIEVRGGDIGA